MRWPKTLCTIGLCLFMMGCPSSGTENPDAGDNDSGTDADTTTGLSFTFASDLELPGNPGGSYAAEITQSNITLANIRAVGDAAPGDERTFASELILAWPPSTTSLSFPEAPAGLYSFIRADIDSVDIAGSVTVDGDVSTYRIEDAPMRQFTVELESVELGSGARLNVEIRVELGDVVKNIDWDAVAPDGQGVLIIDESHAQIDDIRDELDEAFEHEEDDD